MTIYPLSRWLSSRFPDINFSTHDAGHLLVMLFGWRVNPHFGPFHILGFVLIGGGFLLLSAAWPVLYEAQRAHRMATAGPYARIRHPQYAAFILIVFGFLLQWPTLLTLIMLSMVWTYERLALTEEREATAQFGEEYSRYAAVTLRFFPRMCVARADRITRQ